MTKSVLALLIPVLAATLGLAPISARADEPPSPGHRHIVQSKPAAPPRATPAQASPAAPRVSKKSPAAEYTPTVRYRLKTELAEGKMAFVGVGGAIEGVVNPP